MELGLSAVTPDRPSESIYKVLSPPQHGWLRVLPILSLYLHHASSYPLYEYMQDDFEIIRVYKDRARAIVMASVGNQIAWINWLNHCLAYAELWPSKLNQDQLKEFREGGWYYGQGSYRVRSWEIYGLTSWLEKNPY